MEVYDVVIIGAGHNALVCAAYLLKAGYKVLLLEKQPIPGGGSTTEESLKEAAPGFKFNPCAIDHIFIHLGPVVQELELNKYGLEYLFYDHRCNHVCFRICCSSCAAAVVISFLNRANGICPRP